MISSAPITSSVTTNDQNDNRTAGPVTSQADQTQTPDNTSLIAAPDQTQTPDNTSLIAVVISVIIVLVGTVIVLVVIMLLVKKRYSNVTRKSCLYSSLSHSTLKISSSYSYTENSISQSSMRMKWSAGCKTRIQNQQLRRFKLIPLRVKEVH